MKNKTNIIAAKNIMGENFLGPEELKSFSLKIFELSGMVDTIPYSIEEIQNKKDDYLLVYAASKFVDGTFVTIRNLKKIISENGDIPQFYNQDWYDKEDFIDEVIPEGWFFIRRFVYEDSRSVSPNDLLQKYLFPSAIKCTYTFFVAWHCLDIKLWYEDFVWCSNVDHNGDRIYVGKYHDIDGINNDGFSIHRHLALRPCYTCID